MNQIETSAIWKKLLFDGTRFTTRDEVAAIAVKVGKDPTASIRYLQREGYLKRVFRGIFYVSTSDERVTGIQDYSTYEMISEGLRMRGADPWYFALDSALRFNGMTHEFSNVDYVVSGSLMTTKVIQVEGVPLRILKWSERLIIPGSTITKTTRHDVHIRYSDREKTVLDLAYRRYLDGGSERYVMGPLLEYSGQINRGRLISYLSNYPRMFRAQLGDGLG